MRGSLLVEERFAYLWCRLLFMLVTEGIDNRAQAWQSLNFLASTILDVFKGASTQEHVREVRFLIYYTSQLIFPNIL